MTNLTSLNKYMDALTDEQRKLYNTAWVMYSIGYYTHEDLIKCLFTNNIKVY